MHKHLSVVIGFYTVVLYSKNIQHCKMEIVGGIWNVNPFSFANTAVTKNTCRKVVDSWKLLNTCWPWKPWGYNRESRFQLPQPESCMKLLLGEKMNVVARHVTRTKIIFSEEYEQFLNCKRKLTAQSTCTALLTFSTDESITLSRKYIKVLPNLINHFYPISQIV